MISEEQLEDMKKLFRVLDVKKESKLPVSQIRRLMRALDFDLDKSELQKVTEKIDPDKTGFITWDNLVLVMEDRLKEVDTYEDFVEAFTKLDKDKDGEISAPEYRQMMATMGHKLTEEQIEEMMAEADAKGEGVVNMETFG